MRSRTATGTYEHVLISFSQGSGALSFLMLLLQCPGNFLTVAFQILASANISTWIPFLVAGVQQVTCGCINTTKKSNDGIVIFSRLLQVVLLALLTWYDYIKKPYLRYRAKKLRDEYAFTPYFPVACFSLRYAGSEYQRKILS